MKNYILIISLFFGLGSCTTVTRHVNITGMIDTDGDYIYGDYTGAWGRLQAKDSSQIEYPYYKFIFKNPDTVFVENEFILMKRQKKFCIVYKNPKNEGDAKIYKTRSKKSIERKFPKVFEFINSKDL